MKMVCRLVLLSVVSTYSFSLALSNARAMVTHDELAYLKNVYTTNKNNKGSEYVYKKAKSQATCETLKEIPAKDEGTMQTYLERRLIHRKDRLEKIKHGKYDIEKIQEIKRDIELLEKALKGNKSKKVDYLKQPQEKETKRIKIFDEEIKSLAKQK